MSIQLNILEAKSAKNLGKITVSRDANVKDFKEAFYKVHPKYYPSRQSFRTEPRSKLLKDDILLADLDLSDARIYFKDLGPQLSWTTVFLTEYSGPIFVYLMLYLRPTLLYGNIPLAPRHWTVNLCCACWCGHFVKRLLETLFVHRFSNGTMPIRNIFKNSSYYWGFAFYVGYYVNHPLYTPASGGATQVYIALAAFLLCEFGNFSIHVALRNLRPPGSKVRRIPYPTRDPFTSLFSLVSCPNYTYELGSWFAFSVLSQTLPALFFTLAGVAQMSQWALGKHRNYRREFSNYPKNRKSILPFLL